MTPVKISISLIALCEIAASHSNTLQYKRCFMQETFLFCFFRLIFQSHRKLGCPILFFIFRVSLNFHLSFCRICWTEGFCGFICIAFWKMSPPLLLNRRCQSIIWDCKKRNQSLSHPLLSFTHLSAYSPGGCQTQF